VAIVDSFQITIFGSILNIKDMMPPMTCGKINQAIELVIESDLENYDKDLIIDSLERVRRDNIKLRECLHELKKIKPIV
jgi:hypothetical protein